MTAELESITREGIMNLSAAVASDLAYANGWSPTLDRHDPETNQSMKRDNPENAYDYLDRIKREAV